MLDSCRSTAYAYVCDGNARVIGWMRHSIASLLRNVRDASVFILTAGKSRLSGEHSISGASIIDVDRLFADVYGSHAVDMRFTHWPSIIFAKLLVLLVPELARFDRIVYVDADTEVLSPAFSVVGCVDLRAAAVAGVVEGYKHIRCRAVRSIGAVAGVSIPESRYVNAGFLVMDRVVPDLAWAKLCRDAFELACRPGLYIPEQDAVNAVFHPVLLPQFFAYPSPRDPRFAPKGTLMQHFAGGDKSYLDSVVPEVRENLA